MNVLINFFVGLIGQVATAAPSVIDAIQRDATMAEAEKKALLAKIGADLDLVKARVAGAVVRELPPPR